MLLHLTGINYSCQLSIFFTMNGISANMPYAFTPRDLLKNLSYF